MEKNEFRDQTSTYEKFLHIKRRKKSKSWIMFIAYLFATVYNWMNEFKRGRTFM